MVFFMYICTNVHVCMYILYTIVFFYALETSGQNEYTLCMEIVATMYICMCTYILVHTLLTFARRAQTQSETRSLPTSASTMGVRWKI